MARPVGTPEIPFHRDKDGVISCSPKHQQYMADILDPEIWVVEGEGAKRASKDVYGLAAYALLLDIHPNKLHLGLATTKSQAFMLIIEADGFGLLHHFPNGKLTKWDDKDAFIFHDNQGREKIFIYSGGMNEDSYKFFRGPNYATGYMSESNLLHINSLNEIKDRTMSSYLPKLVMTQNPGNPTAEFYESFEKPLTRPGNMEYYNENVNNVWNGPDFRYHHFTQWDNPMLTPKRIKRNEDSFSSEVQKKRNFLGMRVAAEGAIYDMMTEENYYDKDLTIYQQCDWERVLVIDDGSTNPFVILDSYTDEEFTTWYEDEFRWTADIRGRQIVDEEKVDFVIDMIRKHAMGEYSYVIIDPAAVSLINACKRRGIAVLPADNTVMGTVKQGEDSSKKARTGIKLVQDGIRLKKIKLNRNHLKGDNLDLGTIQEMEGYSWDTKAKEKGEDKPLKIRDHGPDCIRYHTNTHIKYPERWMLDDD